MSQPFGVEFRNIRKSYGENTVLDDISLGIREGEFAVMVGPSGSGKSTLLRSLAGLEAIDGGATFIQGREVTDLAPKDRDVAMVFQNYALYSHMTVAENITFGMKIRKEPAPAREAALQRVASMLHLEELLARKPRQLSGGQRQRVAMARAIVRNPRVFLMDEPLSNLDAKLRNEVRASIIEQQRELGVTTLYVTHDQVEAMTMAHRVVVLLDGRLQQVGAPEELYHRPANMFVAGFIGSPAMNFLRADYDGALRFADGSKLCLTEGNKLAERTYDAGFRPGGGRALSLRIGLRPEHAFFTSERSQASGVMHIKATVIGREMLGAEYLFRARTASGEELCVRVPSTAEVPALNEELFVGFSSRAMHFFDAKTEAAVCHAELRSYSLPEADHSPVRALGMDGVLPLAKTTPVASQTS